MKWDITALPDGGFLVQVWWGRKLTVTLPLSRKGLENLAVLCRRRLNETAGQAQHATQRKRT